MSLKELQNIKPIKISQGKFPKLPVSSSLLPAGFPSPNEDSQEEILNLNDFMVGNKTATFFFRVQGDSMVKAGIFDGDVLVVDKSKEAKSGQIVVAVIDGEFTVKRLVIRNEKISLEPENDNYSPIEINSESSFEVWGVVTFNVHKV